MVVNSNMGDEIQPSTEDLVASAPTLMEPASSDQSALPEHATVTSTDDPIAPAPAKTEQVLSSNEPALAENETATFTGGAENTAKKEPSLNQIHNIQPEKVAENSKEAEKAPSTPPQATEAEHQTAATGDSATDGLSKNARKRIAKEQRRKLMKAERKAHQRSLNAKKTIEKRKEREEMLSRLTEEEREVLLKKRRDHFLESRSKDRTQREHVRNILQTKAKFNVCVDLGWNAEMSEKELKSLCRQLMYCYNAMRRCAEKDGTPVSLSICGVDDAIKPMMHVTANGWEAWPIMVSDKSLTDVHDVKRIVYLTHDAETVLDALDPTDVYVIGGIVDRNRLKGATLRKAQQLNVRVAKFNLDDNVLLQHGTRVLTINHCVEILTHAANGMSWYDAYKKVLPVVASPNEKLRQARATITRDTKVIPNMPLRIAPLRTSRRILYRFQTHDVRMYLFEDIVRRSREAVVRAGGELRTGVIGIPSKIKRWTLLRSPHVHKKSREKFWMVSHIRKYIWDADAHVDQDAPDFISRNLPPTVAIRVVEDLPGLMALKPVFDTIERVQNSGIILATTVDKSKQIAEGSSDQSSDENSEDNSEGNSEEDTADSEEDAADSEEDAADSDDSEEDSDETSDESPDVDKAGTDGVTKAPVTT